MHDHIWIHKENSVVAYTQKLFVLEKIILSSSSPEHRRFLMIFTECYVSISTHFSFVSVCALFRHVFFPRFLSLSLSLRCKIRDVLLHLLAHYASNYSREVKWGAHKRLRVRNARVGFLDAPK